MINHREIKKYNIHITSVAAICDSTFNLEPERNAIIVCTDEADNPCINERNAANILRIPFRDVTDEAIPNSFNDEHANIIAEFVTELPDEVTDIFVCCEQGRSRSTAVAAVLLKASGRDVNAVWGNPYYTPNELVYSGLCRALGISCTDEETQNLIDISEEACREIQITGNTGGHELWEILS